MGYTWFASHRVGNCNDIGTTLSIVIPCLGEARVDEERRFKFLEVTPIRLQGFGTTGLGVVSSLKERRYSLLVTCFLVLVSALVLCNASLYPVSSQNFDPSTTTGTSIDPGHFENISRTVHVTATRTTTETTQFTVAFTTSSVYVTIFAVHYTTSTSLITIVKVQFTTSTTLITHPAAPPRVGAPPTISGAFGLLLQGENSSSASPQHPPVVADALFNPIGVGLIPELIAPMVVFLACIFLIRGKLQTTKKHRNP
jgi:hypothetical protein